MSGRVAVIGGGVVGVACAHYLAAAGRSVLLIERGTVGGGCSHANCGYICPSHVLPLAGPGMLGKTLKTLLQRDSPLRVKPRFDPALWRWFYRFARRCNHRDMLEAGHAIAALLNSSRALYTELLGKEGLEADWQQHGLLFVFLTPAEMEHYAATDRLLREQFDLGATRLDGAALVEREPALKPGLAGAWHYDTDCHVRPDLLMRSWRRLVEGRGVEVREGCTFQGFERQGGQVRAVQTDRGRFEVDGAVVAAGAWTPLLAEHLGCNVPIQPGKGYSMTMARPARCPTIPLIFEEHRVAVTPFRDGYRLGSTMEFAGYDATLDRRRLAILTRGAAPYLHQPTAEPVREEWWGWRPMVPDGKPIVGPVPGLDNVWVAAGHGMLGLSMATGTGKLVAELVTGATPHVDPVPYCISRF